MTTEHILANPGRPGRRLIECEHCGEMFYASAARRARGPRVCSRCSNMCFDLYSPYHSRAATGWDFAGLNKRRVC